MTSFVNTPYSSQHQGAARIESVVDAAQQVRQTAASPRALAALLLSAMTAAAMVVAYEVMDTVAEGHLLVMWLALWAVAFAVLALFANTARQLATRLKTSLDGWSRRVAQRRADERLWAMALQDPRLMADLQSAMQYQQSRLETVRMEEAAQYNDVRAVAVQPAVVNRPMLGGYTLQAFQRKMMA